jgi:hypothetical protein
MSVKKSRNFKTNGSLISACSYALSSSSYDSYVTVKLCYKINTKIKYLISMQVKQRILAERVKEKCSQFLHSVFRHI